MIKKTLLTILVICATKITAQSTKVCDKKEETVLDLNSITKCSIEEKGKNTKESKVAVQVTSRRRVVRKRDEATGVMTNDYSHKLAKIKNKAQVTDLSIDKTNNIKFIPFNYVDEIPLFKNCENIAAYKQERCFKIELANHIKRNLKYPENSFDKGIQGRVIVHFIINKEGNIDKMKIVSPYKGEELGKEAERIIRKLPKFKPGKHSGVPVTVKYGLPITFKIPGVKPTNIKKAPKKEVIAKLYDFKDVERIPQFKACKSSKDTSLDCFNKNLAEHIQDNFAYPTKAIDNNIEGKVLVRFVINNKGEVVNIEAIGPANGTDLEEAAKELIEKLPKFKAAEKNGKKVSTKYSFPVEFKLD